MDRLADRPEVRGGFVHAPYSLEQGRANCQPGYSIDVMASAHMVIATTTAITDEDARITADADH